MAKHHLYDESPKIEHKEGGGTHVVKPSAHDKSDHQSEAGVKDEGFGVDNGEGMPDHVRHAMDRHQLHAKHEHEHSLHDHHHPEAPKHEMHTRHEEEIHAMHTRHEKEAGAKEHHKDGAEAGAGGAAGKRSGGGEPIEKVEKEKKG